MTEEKKETGLARLPGRTFSLLPASLGEAREMAEMIVRSGFAPKGYDKPESVIVAIQMGADLGLKPMQALQNISVINGRPSIWGDGAIALAMPALERFKEWIDYEGDEMVASCLLKRKGWPDETVRTFSVKDAKAANLWGKAGPWQTYPKRMLQMRARSWALRDSCADLLLGLAISEEAMDFPDAIDATAVRVEDAPKPGDLLEKVSEPLRDRVEQAFTTLNAPPGLRMAKINEFLGGDVVPDEGAERLLEWCKDEFASRKGRKRASNANTKPTPKAEPPIETTPTPPKTDQKAEPVEGEVVEGQVSSADIPWGNQGQRPLPEGEMF